MSAQPLSARPPGAGLVVRRVPLDALHADPANVRTHPERNLQVIRDSLKDWGQIEALVVQKGTGRVIAGNGRLTVMREQGAAEADVIELDVDDLAATRIGITLNRSAELAGWDPALAETLAALQDAGVMLDSLGFTGDEVTALLDGVAAPAPDEVTAPDEFPEYDESIETEHSCPRCGYKWSGGEAG